MVIQYQDWRSPEYRHAEIILINSLAVVMFAIAAVIVVGCAYWLYTLWSDR